MAVGEKIRLGMIGCGAIAEIYHLPALEQIPGVVGNTVLADPNMARLASLSEKFSVAGSVSDYHELEGKIDGVIVATPPSSHFEISRWFLERGIPVLCEKPLTESFTEAEELVALANQRKTHLAVNQTRRFFPTYQKIRELIQAGVLGELQSITYHDGTEFSWPAASSFHFAAGAKGAWSDTGVHLLDTVCYWLDATPELNESLNDSQGGPEAVATVRMHHEQCQIEIKVSRLGRLMNGFRIEGSLGTIEGEAEDFSEVRVKFKQGGVKVYPCGSRKTKYVDFAKPLLENFVSVVAGKAQPTVPGASTLGTIQLLEQAYESSRIYSMPWNENSSERINDSLSDVNLRPLRVLVTGASGFVGGRVVELMMQSGMAEPVAAIRKWSRASRVARFPTEFAICDIVNASQVDEAVKGVDAIVHCAKTDDRESIVGGTRNLLEAAVKHGIQKFVFLSTAEVYGPQVSGYINEEHATDPTGRLYGDAKIEAEQLCREFHVQGLKPTILRPSLIYGPFSGSWTTNVAKRLQSGNWGLFDQFGEGKANLIYVDDLVQAILRCLAVENAAGEAFNLNGPEVVTWNEYFERFNDALELSPLKHISAVKSRLRTKAMDSVGFITGKLVNRYRDKLMQIYLQGGWPSRMMKRIKGTLRSTPSGSELNDLFARNVTYVDQKAREILGYKPQYDLNAGLELSARWLEHHELAPVRNQTSPSSRRTEKDETTEVSEPLASSVVNV